MRPAWRRGDTNPGSNARVFGRKFVCRRCAPPFPYLDAIKLRWLILSISEADSLSAPRTVRARSLARSLARAECGLTLWRQETL